MPGEIFPSLLWSRIAPVSGMVALCLCDNALVIHTHYSNGRWYKGLLTSGSARARRCMHSASTSLPDCLPACLPLQQPGPSPRYSPLSFTVCFLWVCAHARLIDVKIYELGCALGTCYSMRGRKAEVGGWFHSVVSSGLRMKKINFKLNVQICM